MSNWRTTIKTLFADFTLKAMGEEVNAFGAWNSQTTNNETEETYGPLAVFFEYSEIGDGLEYLKQSNVQQSERVPVIVTLHVIFSSYNEQTQDRAYDYAEKITAAISGRKHALISGVILKVGETEDVNHKAQYDYQMSFGFQLKEVVAPAEDEKLDDANPIDEQDPEQRTGRRLKTNIIGALIETS